MPSVTAPSSPRRARLARKVATGGSALALAASGLFLSAGPASAATSCSGPDCTGKDPAATVCQNDARTVATNSLGVELRYSPTCRSAWARYSGTTGMTVWVSSNTGLNQAILHPGNGASAWTAMIDDKGILAHACGYVSGFGSECTSWY
ncbi:DUF2690 domain-containing protein [Streptomyces sp. NBC_00691]|uniref:DUF2690 domain-containing protein n=1 Tax=Streptomyces sp. NBC_00691 TaxID=2903671 RepID=UPI002E34FBB5|nr:DUF2690 domain-containing protein [Streptomyces sp. NBC_00691]